MKNSRPEMRPTAPRISPSKCRFIERKSSTLLGGGGGSVASGPPFTSYFTSYRIYSPLNYSLDDDIC